MSTKEDKRPSVYLTHGLYYFKITENGKRISVPTGTSNREDAENFRDIYFSSQNQANAVKPKTLFALLKLFSDVNLNPKFKEAKITNSPYTIRTAKGEATRANHLIELIPGSLLNKSLKQINKDHCIAIRDIVFKKYGNRHISHDTFKTFKTIMSYAYDRGFIATPLTFRMQSIKVKKNSMKVITYEDAITIYNTPRCFRNEKERDIFYIFMTTGLRRSELAAIEGHQIKKAKYKDRVFYLLDVCQAFKDSNFKEIGLPKWDKPRTIPLADSTAKILLKYKGDKGDYRLRMNNKKWTLMFKYIQSHAPLDILVQPDAIEKLASHKLRHCLNTTLLAKDANETLVAEYLSWHGQNQREGAMQANYTNIYAKDLLPIADMIEDIFTQPSPKEEEMIILED